MTSDLLQAATSIATAATSSSPSWTEQLAAIAAAVAAGATLLTAAATLLAAAAAITALIFARRAAHAAGDQVAAAQAQVAAAQGQTRRAAELEWQRTRAYVVAYMEPSPTVPEFADLVITNFGATPAYDIELISDPPPARTSRPGDPERERVMPTQPIPMLVPGQQWRTSWEMIGVYLDAELPRRYEVTVSFTDERRGPRETGAVLDWTSLAVRRHVTMTSASAEVVALKDIASSLTQLTKLARGGQEPEETYGGDVLDEDGQPVSAEEAAARRGRAATRRRSVVDAVRQWLSGGSR